MRIHFLGTNGWFNTQTGNSTCTLLETEDCYILLDAGGGFYKTYDIIKDDKPVYMLLSHLHLDHIEGLQVLPLMRWKGGLKIIVQDGMKAELESIMRPPFMPAAKDLAMKTEIIEVSKVGNLPFELQALSLQHPVPTLGYRISTGGKTVAYACDTGITDNILKLADKADLLIAECSWLPGQTPSNNHLNPQQAAQLAKDAGANVLALIHFKADDYTTFEKRDEALVAAGQIFPHTTAPYDGDCMEI